MGAMGTMLVGLIARPLLGGPLGSRLRSRPHLSSCHLCEGDNIWVDYVPRRWVCLWGGLRCRGVATCYSRKCESCVFNVDVPNLVSAWEVGKLQIQGDAPSSPWDLLCGPPNHPLPPLSPPPRMPCHPHPRAMILCPTTHMSPVPHQSWYQAAGPPHPLASHPDPLIPWLLAKLEGQVDLGLMGYLFAACNRG